jgi:protein SCO1
VYLLDSTWTDDRAQHIKLAELRGHYQMLAFIFTQCGATCPMLVKSMQHQVRALPADVRKRTRLLLVTIDPEHDTPSVLRQYRRDMRLPLPEWTLLHGSAANVRELAAVVGFNYDRDEAGTFVHSNVVTLLDPEGEIVLQQQGSSNDWSPIADKIRALEAQQAGSRLATVE